VSSVVVDHPDSWIGVPEDFPNSRWTTAYEWASELVDAFAEDFPTENDGQRATLRDVLVSVALSRNPEETSRLYVSIDEWSGPLFIAEMGLIPSNRVVGFTAAEIAGADDPTAVEKPLVEEFETRGGISGVKCVRYLNPEELGGIVARVDYVVPVPSGFVRFSTSQFDLVDFERVQPRLDDLARSVAVVQ
jgi:hypothetical protein